MRVWSRRWHLLKLVVASWLTRVSLSWTPQGLLSTLYLHMWPIGSPPPLHLPTHTKTVPTSRWWQPTRQLLQANKCCPTGCIVPVAAGCQGDVSTRCWTLWYAYHIVLQPLPTHWCNPQQHSAGHTSSAASTLPNTVNSNVSASSWVLCWRLRRPAYTQHRTHHARSNMESRLQTRNQHRNHRAAPGKTQTNNEGWPMQSCIRHTCSQPAKRVKNDSGLCCPRSASCAAAPHATILNAHHSALPKVESLTWAAWVDSLHTTWPPGWPSPAGCWG
jgi:hypothetical protein